MRIRIAALFVLAVALWGVWPARTLAQDPREEKRRREALSHYHAGEAALRSERLDEAEREFTAAIGLDPLLTLGHYGLGQTYMALRRYPDAVRAFQGCREAFLAMASLGLRNAAEADQRRVQEIQALRESIALLQRNARLSTANQSNIRLMEDRVRELERARHGSTEGLDVPAEVSFSLGTAHLRAGALADAEREYLEALKANPKLGEAHNNLAVVFLRQGRIEEARRHLKEAEKAGFAVSPAFKEDLDKRPKDH